MEQEKGLTFATGTEPGNPSRPCILTMIHTFDWPTADAYMSSKVETDSSKTEGGQVHLRNSAGERSKLCYNVNILNAFFSCMFIGHFNINFKRLMNIHEKNAFKIFIL